jgi:hypothetical protein
MIATKLSQAEIDKVVLNQIPKEIQDKMKAYARGLAMRSPNMKPERLGKLVAKKFNVKLI